MTWIGLCKAGVAVAMINSNNKAKPLLHSIEIVDCKVVIFGTELAGPVSGVPARPLRFKLILHTPTRFAMTLAMCGSV